MAEKQAILSVSLADYRKKIDELRGSLLSLEKTDEQYAKTVSEINRMQGKLNEEMAVGKKNTDEMTGSFTNLQKEIREGKKALQNMTQGTEEYNAKFKEVAANIDKLGDLNANLKHAADDAYKLNVALDVAKVGTSMYGAWTSAAAIFGVENEKVVQSIQKLQAATTLLNSLKQIQLALFDRGSRIYQLFNGAVVTTTASEKTQAVTTEALTTAQEGNVVATKSATVATNGFKKALVSTGIGAIVVLLGALIANWDKVTGAIKNVIGATDDYSNANEELEESFEKVNHQTDNEIKLMKAAGATELEVLQYKKKKIEAQLAEVQAKITDIRATNEQIKTGNKWYKAVTVMTKAALDTMSMTIKPLLYAWDKIFGTDVLKGFQSMIDKAAGSFADMVFGVSDNNEELEELTANANKLKETIEDINVDIKAEGLKKGKGGKNAVDEELEARKKLAKQEEKDLKRNIEEKRRTAQLEYLNGLITEADYKDKLIALDYELAEGYENLKETYKDVDELRVDFSEKATDATFKYLYDKAVASAEQRKKLEEDTAKQIEETYKNAIRDIDFNADKQSFIAEVEFDTKTEGVGSGSIKYIEMENELQHQLFDIREAARQKEIEATAKMYDEKIAKAAGNNAEIERLTKERNDAIAEIELDGQKDSFQLMQKDKKATADVIKKKKDLYMELASSVSTLMTTILSIMNDNIQRKIDEGTISQEEAEEEFERQKAFQYGMVWINTLNGIAGAWAQAFQPDVPVWTSWALGAANSATMLATGIAQSMQIKNMKFGGGGSASAAGGGVPAADISVAPLLNERADAQTMTAMNTEALLSQSQNTRVYIMQSDLEASGKQVEVRQKSTTF